MQRTDSSAPRLRTFLLIIALASILSWIAGCDEGETPLESADWELFEGDDAGFGERPLSVEFMPQPGAFFVEREVPSPLVTLENGNGALVPYRSTRDLEVCDGEDNDGDGATDEDLGQTTCGLGICEHTIENCYQGQTQECDPFYGANIEVCNGDDDDCNGGVDDLGNYQCGVGQCFHTVPKCLNGQPQFCNPLDGSSLEVCDGLDNDCDSSVDEEMGSTTCGLGICYHNQANCMEGVLSPCDPYFGAVDEECDGLDNDCDGDTDEDFGEASCGLGECLHTVPLCNDGNMVDCDPYLGSIDELCDGLDNDCDGFTDEGFGNINCGHGECAHSVPLCFNGDYNSCDPLEGATEESCDGLDNNCDGVTDEDLGTLSCGVGQCEKTIMACQEGTLQVCDPSSGSGAEICDGVDNDCDGATDEEQGTTTCGLGICEHIQDNCIGGLPQYCNPYLGMQMEVCDNIDNNCDGFIDENMGESMCGIGECLHVVPNCVNGQTQYCNPLDGASLEGCDGLDNDCNGLIDEGLGTTICGVGECHRVLQNCVSGEIQECDPMEGAVAEVCDGLDNDCDGETDEEMGTTTCGLGPCEHEVDNCMDGVPQECDPLLGASVEVCDNYDNDCDDKVDEGLGNTTCGLGECAHVVHNCVDGQPQECLDPMNGASDEECDGLDNDCDGETDEGFGETTCGQGECEHTVSDCWKGELQDCDPMEGASDEVCDDLDNDCDGDTDEESICELQPCPPGSLKPCDDEDPCTFNDHCDGSGSCVGEFHPSCLEPEDIVEDKDGNGGTGLPDSIKVTPIQEKDVPSSQTDKTSSGGCSISAATEAPQGFLLFFLLGLVLWLVRFTPWSLEVLRGNQGAKRGAVCRDRSL